MRDAERSRGLWPLLLFAGVVIIWETFGCFIKREKNKVLRSSEAMNILDEHLEVYRNKSYEDLKKLVGDVEVFEVTSESGKIYNLEFMVVWDGQKGEDIRVMGAVDDQETTVYSSVSSDFIVSKDGTFVGEDE